MVLNQTPEKRLPKRLAYGLSIVGMAAFCACVWLARASAQGQGQTVPSSLKIPYDTFDPHLGYSRIPEFVAYGDVSSPDALRIVALGGSTTDPFNSVLGGSAAVGWSLSPNNWPQELANLLAKPGIGAKVFNLGVGGYSSNQEVLKLIRDGLLLSPHLVISLNGVNDLGFIWSCSPEYPMVSPYQHRVVTFLSDANAGMKVSLGMKADPKFGAVGQWEKNIRTMRAVSKEFGAEYLCFLQPIMGFGAYSLSAAEEEMLKRAMQASASQGQIRSTPGVHASDYQEALDNFYRASTGMCKRIPYCVDLTDAFKGKTGMYVDARHVSTEGNRVISRAIFDELKARRLLRRR